MASSATPRVAVVGGGIAGTLASLVLRNRGLNPVVIDQGRNPGGRLRGAARSVLDGVDAGVPFIRASDVRLQVVLRMLEQQGLLARWNGRFGLLGNQGGGFLPASIVGQATAAGMRKKNSDDEKVESDDKDETSFTDSGDFCGFVTHCSDKTTTYVAVPSQAELCPEICRLASIESMPHTTVRDMVTRPEGGWELQFEGEAGGGWFSFDALILASHNPSLAADIVNSILQAESSQADTPNNQGPRMAQNRLKNLADHLYETRKSKLPIFTWSGRFPADDLPFDAVSVPGSHLVQFLARESSKPGRAGRENGDQVWTAVSTSRLAHDVLLRHASGREATAEASAILSDAVAQLLFPNLNTTPLDASAVRWGAAFTSRPMGLKEDSIFLNPWRLAIAGDFIASHQTPLEAAALSGLEAGERVAAMFQAMEDASQ